jgi:hypothetical protein
VAPIQASARLRGTIVAPHRWLLAHRRTGMGRSVHTRVVALIKKEGYGAQRTIARMSGVAQPMLCQWLRGRCAAAVSTLLGFRYAPRLPAWDGVQVRG